MTEEKRRALGQAMYGIGGLLLFVFGLFTLLYWVGSRTIFRMAKSRWEIENQGFNDAKNRYGFEHICHHERHSLLLVWLLTCLALTIERLYRIRYLHRGPHPILQAITLWQLLWLSLSRPVPHDTS